MKFDNAREAIRRYESKDVPSFNENDEGTSDYDPDDDGNFSRHWSRHHAED